MIRIELPLQITGRCTILLKWTETRLGGKAGRRLGPCLRWDIILLEIRRPRIQIAMKRQQMAQQMAME